MVLYYYNNALKSSQKNEIRAISLPFLDSDFRMKKGFQIDLESFIDD